MRRKSGLEILIINNKEHKLLKATKGWKEMNQNKIKTPKTINSHKFHIDKSLCSLFFFQKQEHSSLF